MYKYYGLIYKKFGWDQYCKGFFQRIKPLLFKWKVVTHHDVACGIGTFVNLVSKMGIESSGSDISYSMIKAARENYNSLDFKIADMRNIKLPKKVDLITCNYDTINHLIKFRDWNKVFKRAFENLKNDGIFVFDMNSVKTITKMNRAVITSKKDYLLIEKKTRQNNICEFDNEWFLKVKKDLYKRYKDVTIEKAFHFEKVKKSLLKIGFKKVDTIFRENEKIENETRIYIVAYKL